MAEWWEDEYDLGAKTAAEVEAGGVLKQPGWYRVVLEDLKPGEQPGFEKDLRLIFKVTEGPFKGSIISEFLNYPDNAGNVEKGKKLREKRDIWATRMGLIPKDAKGRGGINWSAAIGQEYVIEVTHQTWKADGERKAGEKTGIDYLGVYGLDHPKIPAAKRLELKLPAARKDDAGGNGQQTLPEVNGGGAPARPARGRQPEPQMDTSGL
jgi:hypothetical protein